jgi:molybdopterin-guanine dinucleotide biosynthesis adapter protein
MHVVAFCGWSGSGKTTVLEGVIAALRAQGRSVSVIKHAHHRFDIDHPGKDSWRHRQAGAGEVLIASRHRLALLREYAEPLEHRPADLIAELSPCDWVLVEGFRQSDLPKFEVWRSEPGEPPLYPEDAAVIAVATDDPRRLPQRPRQPLLPLNDPPAIAAWLLDQAPRLCWNPPNRP